MVTKDVNDTQYIQSEAQAMLVTLSELRKKADNIFATVRIRTDNKTALEASQGLRNSLTLAVEAAINLAASFKNRAP